MRPINTITGILALTIAIMPGPQLAFAAPEAEKPPATQPSPAVRQAWARKLIGLKGSDWRTSFQVGQQLAALPPEQGFAILKENWAKIDSVEARQQILKAWVFKMPYPLKPRNHPRLAEVLELGLKDPSPDVQEWAKEFSGKGKKESSQSEADDVADVPAQDLLVGGDAKKRYFLIGTPKKEDAPSDGYKLLIILPGGDGSADFHPFIRRIYKNVLDKNWLIAQPVATKWESNQQITWPIEKPRYPSAKFTTEEFIEAVVTDVKTKAKIDPKRVFLLGWSSGGPPCYAAALRKDSSVTGVFVVMSIFKPEQVQAIQNAKGKAFYLLHSPDDKVVPMRFAEAAQKALQTAGATVQLDRYAGGHGWQGDVWATMKTGVEWLDKQTKTKS